MAIPRIDFHTHILWGLDDGAADEQATRELLHSLWDQGAEAVVLTPHYYSHHQPLEAFLAQRQLAYERLQSASGFPPQRRYLGAEVYLTKYLLNQQHIERLCIEGTRTMLIELPFSDRLEQEEWDLLDTISGDFMITPLLAHIERYPALVGSKRTLAELQDMGCCFQMNLPSFTLSGKRQLLRLAEDGFLQAYGTDCHNMQTRPPVFADGLRVLEKKLSEETQKKLRQDMLGLLNK